MRHVLLLVSGLAVASCASRAAYQPAVDLTGVDAARYAADLDGCRAYADPGRYGPLVANAVIGASAGAGLGAVLGWLSEGNAGLATSYGAISGGVAGAGVGAASPAPEVKRALDECLRNNGYKVND